jgi:putative DNA primase/helicase
MSISMIDISELKAAAAGRELDILVDVAQLDREVLDGKHHPCPQCEGTDRFRLVDVEAGAVRCNACFATKCGDFIAAVGWAQGWTFPESIKAVAEYLGIEPSGNGNGHAAKPGELFRRIATTKNVSVESLKAYGAHEAQRGQDQVIRLSMYDLAGERCGSFDLGLSDGLRKGKTTKGARLGVFLPHDEDGKPIMPGTDRITIAVEGPKDAAALHRLEYYAVGLPTCKPVNGLAEIFRDCSVVLIPDRDEPSTEGFGELAAKLTGVARAVEVVELPLPMGNGGDVRDLLKEKTGEGVLREMLRKAGGKVNQCTKDSASSARRVGENSASYLRTDLGNAGRLVSAYGRDLRFCHPWQKWLVWDGKRWAIDQTGEVERLAKRTAREILHEAADEPDKDRMKALTRFAMASQSAPRLAAMVALARSETGIPVMPDKLDSDVWLFNCANGTIDLRTGELRPHQRSDMITKAAPVEYDPDATCPAWLDFQDKVCAGSDSLTAFKQRLYGACLTGDVSDQVLIIFHGVGSNGKSTETGTVLAMQGDDYSMQAKADLLMVKRNEHPTQQADLFGKRLVCCSESEEGHRLAESQVKDFTGGDPIRTRRMREDYWQFNPTHKLILATNHKPQIRGTDHAIWRRILLVPFKTRFWNPDQGETGPAELQRDNTFPKRLESERAGILAWCVQGCLEWQQDGLGYPEEIRAATEAYRTEEDIIGTFLADCCIVERTATIRSKDLFAGYQKWAENAGERPIGTRRFGGTMTERGFQRFKTNGHWYSGIDLLRDDDFTQ